MDEFIKLNIYTLVKLKELVKRRRELCDEYKYSIFRIPLAVNYFFLSSLLPILATMGKRQRQ